MKTPKSGAFQPDLDTNETLRAQLVDIYNLYRTSLLNVKYYSHSLALWKRINNSMEIALALVTTGTAWAFWKTDFGNYLWMAVSGLAAVLGIVKPIVRLSHKIEKFSKLRTGYSDLYYDLDGIVAEVKTNHVISAEMMKKIRNARERLKKLAPDDILKPNVRLIKKFQDEVNREVPPSSLWVPRTEVTHDRRHENVR